MLANGKYDETLSNCYAPYSANGSANTTMPKGGWTNSALAQLFRYSPLTNATNPLPSSVPSKHPTSGPKHLSRGSLAGIMIGSISGAILMLIFAICLYQRTLKGGAREDTIADDIGVSKQEVRLVDNQEILELQLTTNCTAGSREIRSLCLWTFSAH